MQMNETDRFDPFNNRLCRNVRNALSEGFKEVLDQRDMHPVQRIAGFFLDDPQPPGVDAYINHRLAAYDRVLADVKRRQLDDPLDIAMVIWDQRLFFETHEYLETHWMRADGDEKKLYQAMIRAAGTYVHLEQGNLTGAGRIAAKAISVLEGFRSRLAPHADAELLIDKLRALDPMPPRLSGSTPTTAE
jgi:hypothetical protein